MLASIHVLRRRARVRSPLAAAALDAAPAALAFALATLPAMLVAAAPTHDDVDFPGPTPSGAPTSAPPPATSASAAATSVGSLDGDPREGLDPFPSTGHFLDYGVSFASEALLTPGGLCPKEAKEKCVLGGGGGLAFAAAYRAPGYSLGAVYEVTFHDSSNIYQRGVLQQLRAEWRVRPRWLSVGGAVTPFLGLGGGFNGYGDNWALSTYGPAAHAMIGGEIDLGVKVALVVAIAYRAMYLRSFVDASGQDRPSAVAHLLGLQLGLELHDPL